ncbi:UNVERIFIED_CONTAM: hypothetical protein RMT77_017147 [Armadillidium vulgare]
MSGNDTWVFDSLVAFLRGPVWNVPILTFIENKSIIFEPDCPEDEDHRKIHEEYKNLVDFMLGSYMEDIGITPEQFEAACGQKSGNVKSALHQSLFEQVWAADDYEIFHRMMIQKNLEIQLQALELLQKKYGIIPESFTASGDLSKDEQTIMEEVIKKSIEEHEAYQKSMNMEQKMLEKALAESKEEVERLEEERKREGVLLKEAINKSPEERKTPVPAPPPKPASQISPEEVAKRQEYLRQQRDKLLEMKRQEREKQLSAFEESAPQSRPKSSKAARKAMKGSSIDPQTLQVRKALAERLKAEVIDN